MAKFKGWKRRYAYLDDYKKGLDGQYVYYGRHYIYQGEIPLTRYKGLLGIIDALLAALYLAGGFQNAGAIWSCWYTVVPYALEVLAVFLLIWKSVSLIMEKAPVKAYIYKKTVPWFRPLGLILAVLTGLSVIGTVVCMIIHSDVIRVTGCVIYLITQVLLGLTGVLFAGKIRKYPWVLDPSEEPEE